MGGKMKSVIGFDLGGTKMMAGLVDGDFKVLAREKRKTRGKNGREDTFTRMVGLIESLIENNAGAPSEIAGIGIGSPGPLDPSTGVIGNTPNLGWNNFPLREKMETRFGVPVAVGNDVDMGTCGEFHFGAARGGRHLLGVFPGTGIGGGLIIDGRLHLGASGSAAEIGHVVVDPAGPRCGCGRKGCLEAFASRLAIAGQCAVLAMRGHAPALVKEAGYDPRDYRSKALSRAIAGGDERVEEVVREAARRIGRVIAGMVNVISPDTIILGGGLVEAMPDIFLEEAEEMIAEFTLPEIAGHVRVVAAELGDDAVMMGAARLIREKLAAAS